MVSVQVRIFCHGQAAHLPSRDKAGRTAAEAAAATAAAAKATNMPRDKAGREGGRREGDKAAKAAIMKGDKTARLQRQNFRRSGSPT